MSDLRFEEEMKKALDDINRIAGGSKHAVRWDNPHQVTHMVTCMYEDLERRAELLKNAAETLLAVLAWVESDAMPALDWFDSREWEMEDGLRDMVKGTVEAIAREV